MRLEELNSLYERKIANIDFIRVHNELLIELSNLIYDYGKELRQEDITDISAEDFLKTCRILLFRYLSHLIPYNAMLDYDDKEALKERAKCLHSTYQFLYEKYAAPILQTFSNLSKLSENTMAEILTNSIVNTTPRSKIAVVTKKIQLNIEHEIGFEEKEIKYFSYKDFTKSVENFDHIYYIGSPNYFGLYAKTTFKADNIHFLAYDVYGNRLVPSIISNPISKENVISTIYRNTNIGKEIERKTLYETTLLSDEETVLQNHRQKNSKEYGLNEYGNQKFKVNTVVFENGKFAFFYPDSEVRIYKTCNSEKMAKVRFSSVDIGDFLIIRAESEHELISRIADEQVIGEKARYYRYVRDEWKSTLKKFVYENGPTMASRILMDRGIPTATLINIGNWLYEYSIKPKYFKDILEAIGYWPEQARLIDYQMKIILGAHIKAGRIIYEEKLKPLLDLVDEEELLDNGYFELEIPDFKGESFYILQVSYISESFREIYSSQTNKLYDELQEVF